MLSIPCVDFPDLLELLKLLYSSLLEITYKEQIFVT